MELIRVTRTQTTCRVGQRSTIKIFGHLNDSAEKILHNGPIKKCPDNILEAAKNFPSIRVYAMSRGFTPDDPIGLALQ